MDSILFLAFAVAAGFVLLGLVVYSYVRPRPEHRPSVTALLGLLGFALVASPNWTRISIRSDGLELSLLREIEARQLQALERITSPRPGETPARASDSHEPELLEAFERGELDLRKLSNAELLALNGTLTERANGERQR